MVYIGANDGMLHAFNASTGHEVFAYVPHSVFNNLVKLVNPFYNPQHQFFVDSTPQASDVQFGDGSWHTVLFGSERAGGTASSASTSPIPRSSPARTMWPRMSSGSSPTPNMGQTFSLRWQSIRRQDSR